MLGENGEEEEWMKKMGVFRKGEAMKEEGKRSQEERVQKERESKREG